MNRNIAKQTLKTATDHEFSMRTKSTNLQIDPFIVGNIADKLATQVLKDSDGYDSFSSCGENSDDSAKTLKSPAGIALPSCPTSFPKVPGNTISGEYAQSFYTPESCIFVAK